MAMYPTTSSAMMCGKTHFDMFVSTRSRVIRLFNLPTGVSGSGLRLSELLSPLMNGPTSLWTLKEEWGGRPVGKEEFVWAVFKSHDQAMIALNISTGGGLGVSISTALESDLEPFMKLRKVQFLTWQHPNIPVMTTATTSANTNSNSFRQGDWICTCTAHNFMRNSICIVCGSPRHYHYRRNVPSSLKQLPIILTPSGRALSTGGKVQNISRNPMAPCIIFWPDNEPFPESSQIRPAIHYGSHIPAPPILNTGNKGPIEQQPGDWVCGKCEYLNWRRRKVCQTCYPYAEGNTDGISPNIQAERLAVLAQVLGTATATRTIMTTTPHSPSSTTGTTSIHCSPNSSPSISILSVPLFSSSSEFKSEIITSSCPGSVLSTSRASHPPLVLPSYMKEDDNDNMKVNGNNYGYPYSPPPPPLVPSMPPAVTHALSASIRRQSSLTFMPAHDTLSSIWTMSGEELDSTLQFNTCC